MGLVVNKSLVETPVAQFAPRLNMTLDELIRAQPRVMTQVQSAVGNRNNRVNTPVDNSDVWIRGVIILLVCILIALLIFIAFKIIIWILCVAIVIAIFVSAGNR